jgi:hypothetical protein
LDILVREGLKSKNRSGRKVARAKATHQIERKAVRQQEGVGER